MHLQLHKNHSYMDEHKMANDLQISIIIEHLFLITQVNSVHALLHYHNPTMSVHIILIYVFDTNIRNFNYKMTCAPTRCMIVHVAFTCNYTIVSTRNTTNQITVLINTRLKSLLLVLFKAAS